MRITAGVILALASLGVAAVVDLPPQEAVLEALLRHLVAEAQQSRTAPLAICVAGYDQAQASLVRDRVKADVPIISDRSACPEQGPRSEETRYVIVWLGAAVRVADDQYIARAKVYRNRLDASERLFTLNLKDGRWVITKSTLNWVA